MSTTINSIVNQIFKMLKNPKILGLILAVVLIFFFMRTAPQLGIEQASKTWGSPQLISEKIYIGNNEEVTQGEKAWVFNKQNEEYSIIRAEDWDKLQNGDMAIIADEITRGISGSKPLWIKISWEGATYYKANTFHHYHFYLYAAYEIKGLFIEAVVENENAGLTGIEIVAIITAITFLIVVVGLIAWGSWITYKITTYIDTFQDELNKVFPGLGSLGAYLMGVGVFAIIVFAVLVLVKGWWWQKK